MSEAYDYASFAQELYDGCIISDPWIDGRERFRLEPVVLSSDVYERFCRAGESIGALHEEFCRIIWSHPEFLDDFFGLTPFQKLMWLSSGGRWHGIARLDLFVLADGSISCCEMNSDTPSGEAEAVLINDILHCRHRHLHNPNRDFEQRFVDMALATHRAMQADDDIRPTVGIVYPTEMPEDLSMITLYRQWFASRGFETIVGSPFNLSRDTDGRLRLFDLPINIMLRHYKTDWWGERFPVWADQADFLDPDPLDAQILDTLDAEADGRVSIVNPFGAVLTQNKLAMSFFWKHQNLFSPQAQETIRSYIPETHRLIDVTPEQTPRSEWTLKSDYGCEGDEVILGPKVSDQIWEQSLEMAVAGRWIVQRYFDAAIDENGMIPNYGLYLIAGEASGIFTRLSPEATDYHAVTAPTFVR